MAYKEICGECIHWRPVIWNKEIGDFKDEEAKCLQSSVTSKRNDTCDKFLCYEKIYGEAPPPASKILTDAEVFREAHFKEKKKNKKSRSTQNEKAEQLKELREHQKEVVERYKDAEFAPIFHGTGCGKSASALRIVAHLYATEKINAVLIIAPNKVHTQWYREQIPLWLCDVKYDAQLFGGHQGASIIKPFLKGVLNIVVVNVDTFSTPSKWQNVVDAFLGEKYYIILDEATAIKNIKAKRTDRILYSFNTIKRRGRAIVSSTPNSVGRAILTGTPITNSVIDAWSMMEFLKPNYWGRNFYAFQNRYGMFYELYTDHGKIKAEIDEDIWSSVHRCPDYAEAQHLFGVTEDTYLTIKSQDRFMGAYKHVDEIKERLQKDASFCRLEDVEDMPPQYYVPRIVRMGKEQAECYSGLENNMIAEYNGRECPVSSKLTMYMRLQQCSSGFLPFSQRDIQSVFEFEEADYDEPEIEWFKEVPKLDQLYQDIEGVDKPTIVVTRFTAEAARIYEELLAKHYKVCLQTGWKQEGTIDEFQKGEYDIMVANIKVISQGFNLQNAHTMFLYSNTFSLESRIQSEGRIFRIGQTKPSVYFDYINENTIDMKMVACLKQRRNLMDYIRGVSLTSFLNEWDGIMEEEYSEIYGSHI